MASIGFGGYRPPMQLGNLRYLAHYLACLTIVMAGLSLVLASPWQIAIPAKVFWIVLPGHFVLTLATYYRASRNRSIATGGYLAVLAVSTLLLGGFLYLTGGHTNPLISLLLLPVAMSAAMLHWQATLLLALLVLALYGGLTQFFTPLASTGSEGLQHFMQLHLLGMWLTFVLSVLLIFGVVVPLTTAMQRQREQMALQREKMLRDERLVALATFAASAAHQLGTPLSTLAVLVDDLRDEITEGQASADLKVMAGQVDHCKHILRSMTQRAESVRKGARQVESVQVIVQRLREEFALLHPTRTLRLGSLPEPDLKLLTDVTLDQAILNLLDNAAQAGTEDPVLEAQREGNWLCLLIRDFGRGIPEAIRDQLGQPFVSSREGGTGLGLFLSHATINRLGGTLSLMSSGHGTLTEIRLPLTDTSDRNSSDFHETSSATH